MGNEKLNELKQFFGAYFHQDWNLDASAPDDVVRLFISDGYSNDELINLAKDIEKYAATKTDDAATEEGLLKELGCYYMPSADNVGAKAWLNHVATLLRSAIE
ncbi:contact-dependent growth inhibition system immunity protein [Noviherbaspirillum malthae]|uniref:contact-dependent growth inhibition system immunity protein n=1 Tax=Noviherbaspirillum malthae TaxID=1260987 RepID=UPI00188E45B7|nr:contact-dependent growth inhibition system immunity protein [Noviherbaspirillum malthae]